MSSTARDTQRKCDQTAKMGPTFLHFSLSLRQLRQSHSMEQWSSCPNRLPDAIVPTAGALQDFSAGPASHLELRLKRALQAGGKRLGGLEWDTTAKKTSPLNPHKRPSSCSRVPLITATAFIFPLAWSLRDNCTKANFNPGGSCGPATLPLVSASSAWEWASAHDETSW